MAQRRRQFVHDEDGASAVEFAMVMPVFVLLVLGIVGFATVVSTYNGVQQLVAEAARASVAGLSDSERDRIARSYISGNAGAYPFIDPGRLQVTTLPQPTAFQVQARYDMSDSFVFLLAPLVPLPSPVIVRSAAVQRGGY